MPVRNGGKFLVNSLNSMLLNASAADEIIVVDDGSTDETGNILVSLKQLYPQTKILRTTGLGIVEALNLGVSNATRDWIARYDVDDQYQSDRISIQLDVADDDTVAIFSDYEFWLEGKSYYGWMPSPVSPIATFCSLLSSQQTPHPVALIRRDALLRVGGYRAFDFPAEDLGLWLRLSKIGNLISVPETLLFYRLSLNSLSGGNREAILRKKEELLTQYFDLTIIDAHFLNGVLMEFEAYSKTPLSGARRLYFVRNLIQVRSKYPEAISKSLIFRLFIRTVVKSNPRIIFGLVFHALRRKWFRHSKLRPKSQ